MIDYEEARAMACPRCEIPNVALGQQFWQSMRFNDNHRPLIPRSHVRVVPGAPGLEGHRETPGRASRGFAGSARRGGERGVNAGA